MTKKNYSKIYRIMHWVMAITFLLMLLTISLRMGWMNKYGMAEIMQDHLQKLGRPLPDAEAIAIAKKIRYPMWKWHPIFGYILASIIALRFILPVFGHMKFQNPLKKNLSKKEKFQNWIYLVFYGFVAISLVTGLILQFLPKSYKYPSVTIHKLSIYYLLGYIMLHISCVLYAEFTKDKGIISRIVSGKPHKSNPKN